MQMVWRSFSLCSLLFRDGGSGENLLIYVSLSLPVGIRWQNIVRESSIANEWKMLSRSRAHNKGVRPNMSFAISRCKRTKHNSMSIVTVVVLFSSTKKSITSIYINCAMAYICVCRFGSTVPFFFVSIPRPLTTTIDDAKININSPRGLGGQFPSFAIRFANTNIIHSITTNFSNGLGIARGDTAPIGPISGSTKSCLAFVFVFHRDNK